MIRLLKEGFSKIRFTMKVAPDSFRYPNFLLVCIFISINSFAQPLTSVNFRDKYNPESEVQLAFQVVKIDSLLQVQYRVLTRTTDASQFSITWEKRDSFTQREGSKVNPNQIDTINSKELRGNFSFPIPQKSWVLVAKVTRQEPKSSWTYFKLIDPAWPVNGWLEREQARVTESYMTINKPYIVHNPQANPIFVSYYNSDFNAATPPFSTQQPKADRFMFYDSTFRLTDGEKFIPLKQGLYLFQKDTNAAEGFAFRCVGEIYPKFSKIADLVDPLIYITTPEEYSDLVKANGDKAKFDKVILDITRDKERAKNFMRSYFRRIELANQYFSSYKTGWKTDRGMIYTIFGTPDEVSINDGTENWNYTAFNARFTFVKSGSVYDPDNYVLLRDKRFTQTWFSTIDLWRKSRF